VGSVADILSSRTLSPEPFAKSPLPVFSCAFLSSAVERPVFASGAVRSMLENNLMISHVRGDIEVETGGTGEGRVSTALPNSFSGRLGSWDLPPSESGGELDMMPTKLRPSGLGLA
jgi:hypothetical protein